MKKDLPLIPKIIIYAILIIFCLLCIIPLLTVVSISFSTDMQLIKTGYSIFPKGFTLEAYKFVFKDISSILRSYGVTIVVTGLGLVMGLILNALIAYVLSRSDYVLHKQLTIYLLIPMLLSGGLVPSYIWITQYLHMKDTLWVMIIPILIQPWFIILMRTFFKDIPISLVEAATVDGAGGMTGIRLCCISRINPYTIFSIVCTY